MKIEKINENKIRATFNYSDLEKNNISVHSFMSNSIEDQSLFLNILNQAEQNLNFNTDNYKLYIDSLALSNGYFIVTVTRIGKESSKPTRVQAHKKVNLSENNIFIYKFSNLSDLYNFENFLATSKPNIANYLNDKTSLYKYNNYYFLILQNLSTENSIIVSSILSEFSNLVNNSDLILNKIKEYGLLIFENSVQEFNT